MSDFPQLPVAAGHIEPVPRRIRAKRGAEVVLDTTNALYVWEHQYYPQYYVPVADVTPSALDAVTTHGEGELAGTVRFEWDEFDAWFEEEEEVFVHPRSPYVRVDSLRSTRTVRIEVDGVVVAESSSPVMVFETGLPTRYYLNRTEVDFAHLVPSETETSCPYKGKTSGYWSIRVGDNTYPDLAWAYDFPTRELSPITGLIAFYNEKVDVFVDGHRQA